ncbi:uncharacterized protein CTRU02_201268 [Colletotrichum truncatum]|uniref:Uncharacterized protein n=1 Tax=Colletotrichum truncatum TaxID=5467 RepID=A0ACC3ZGV1_COLTU|nr:uncharacterized protein CTRU02_08058 [Colletotrichum truncatum]KAF6790538.1 hypothetical protein CTRU02_08058 [Colletotrichum truncatum]
MKGKEEVIAEFNEYVNMTAEELESWLKSDDSNSAGWPKDDADGEGETVGHDSGRKIVEILSANPEKKEDEYTDEQVEHMRKVVAYWKAYTWNSKRHLAQETKTNSEKSPEEVKKTKSYASLKNWGHDFLKAQGKEDTGKKNGKSSDSKNGDEEKAESNGSKKNGKKEEAENDEQADESKEQEEVAEDETEEKTGDKRKKTGEENGSNKKRQTRQGEGETTKADEDGDENEEEVDGAEEDDEEMEDGGEDGGKTKKGPKKGDTVSWNWGNGQPEGKVLDVKEEKTTIETKRGNEVSRNGDPDDPAVVLDTGKSKAIKSAHELN